MNGEGIMKWPDGRKYEGNYLNDKKHGFGILEWRNLLLLNVRQLMGENILDIGNQVNNMEMENILMVKQERKDFGNREKE